MWGGIALRINDIEYWAGLADADGTFGLSYSKREGGKYYANLSFRLYQKNPYILEELNKYYGNNINKCNKQGVNCLSLNSTQSRDFIKQILPHLTVKREVAKLVLDNERRTLTKKEKENLVNTIKNCRYKNTYPINISDKWAAGFIDGDGCISCERKKKEGSLTFMLSAVSHKDQNITLIVLQNLYGGKIYKDGDCERWKLALNLKRIDDFKRVGRHLKIKKRQYLYVKDVLENNLHKQRYGATKESNIILKNVLSVYNSENSNG